MMQLAKVYIYPASFTGRLCVSGLNFAVSATKSNSLFLSFLAFAFLKSDVRTGEQIYTVDFIQAT